MRLLQAALIVAAAEFVLGALLTFLPRLGRAGRWLGDAWSRAPLLDCVIAAITWAPWVAAAALAGWRGLLGAILGQIVGLYLWTGMHVLLNRQAARGPRIMRTLERIVGTWPNHIALWLTTVGVPALWLIRLLEVFAYPFLVWLLRFPRYRHGEWVNLSRHKFQGLVGHDLAWCFYCDWMTGVWSLGSEMLRNVESFWCPIRFANATKCENCRTDFPDLDNGWVPADGTMAQVAAVLEEKYSGEHRSWFGHPSRLRGPRDTRQTSDSNGEDALAGLEEMHRELLLEHATHPHNHHPMPQATNQAEGHTPVCNDRIQVFLRLVDGRIEDISFQGAACPICTASASMMTKLLKGKTQEAAAGLFREFHEMMVRPAGAAADGELGDLAALAGVQRFPSRIKCATLPWHTMKAALGQVCQPAAAD